MVPPAALLLGGVLDGAAAVLLLVVVLLVVLVVALPAVATEGTSSVPLELRDAAGGGGLLMPLVGLAGLLVLPLMAPAGTGGKRLRQRAPLAGGMCFWQGRTCGGSTVQLPARYHRAQLAGTATVHAQCTRNKGEDKPSPSLLHAPSLATSTPPSHLATQLLEYVLPSTPQTGA